MGKCMTIGDVNSDTRLKMRLLCIAKGTTMAELLKELVNQAYEADQTVPDKRMKTKMRRLIRKWQI